MHALSNLKYQLCFPFFVFVLVAVGIFPAAGFGAPCESYPGVKDSQVGSLPLGYASTMAVDGSLAYLSGYMQGIQVIDLSDPVQPELLADLNLSLYLLDAAWVEPAGDVGYVGGVIGEIPIIDLSDPSAPEEIARFPLLFEVQATATEGDFLYAATYGRRSYAGVDTSTFYIIDVSDPSAPVQLAEVLDNHYGATTMKVRDGVAYLGASSGFHAFDVSDPNAVVELDSLNFYSLPVDMEFVGDLLYLAGLTGELHIVDVADPANLVVLSSTDLKVGSVQAISVFDGMAVVACKESGLRVVDVTDPANPSEPASWATSNSCYGVHLEQDRIIAMTSGEMIVAATDFPEPVSPLYTKPLETYPTRQVLANGLLYYLQTGLHIMDVSDPVQPMEIGYFSDGEYYSRMSLDGPVIYLSSMGEAGVIAVDVSDPTTPVKLSTLTNEETYSIHAANGLLAVGPRSGFVSLYKVSDPANPELLGTHAGGTAYRAYGVALAGDHLYMTTGIVQVLDISDPGNIHTVASLSSGFGLDLVATGEWIFTGGGDGINVFRFVAPETLELMATRPLPYYAQDLELAGGTLSAACKRGGVHVFDVVNPANPVWISGITAAEDARCVAVGGEIVAVGSATYPVANDGVIEFYSAPCEANFSPVPGEDLPAVPVVLSAVPNPFNPQVRFAFEVKQAGHANLSIFDMRGRRVATLVDGPVDAGHQQYDWNGRDSSGRALASGGYVARLRTADMTSSRQVTFLR